MILWYFYFIMQEILKRVKWNTYTWFCFENETTLTRTAVCLHLNLWIIEVYRELVFFSLDLNVVVEKFVDVVLLKRVVLVFFNTVVGLVQFLLDKMDHGFQLYFKCILVVLTLVDKR